jgi:hypothetical protein
MNSLSAWADRINPDMGVSVREGMEETLTVIRLGVSPFLKPEANNCLTAIFELDALKTLLVMAYFQNLC